jgi:hypothetical protein
MNEFDLNKIVHEPRATSTGYHFVVARAWRILGEQDKLHSPLAYSAFEFRCGIERTLIEQFALIRDHRLSEAELKLIASMKGIRNALLRNFQTIERFRRTQIFNRLYSQGAGSPPAIWMSVIDFERLEKLWVRLSEYCHRQLRPDATWQSMGDEWLLRGYQLLNEVESYLWEITTTSHIGWVQPHTMQPEMHQAMQEFVDGLIDQGTLETRLNLMSPIITARVSNERRRNAG